MLYWLESWYVFEDQGSWALQQQLGTVLKWCASRGDVDLTDGGVCALVNQWCQGILQLIERHGPTLKQGASEIHFVDPSSFDDPGSGSVSIFSRSVLPDPPLHTPHIRIASKAFAGTAITAQEMGLHHPVEPAPLDEPLFTLFQVDRKRGVAFMASYCTPSPELKCQSIQTGRYFKPMRLLCQYEKSRYFYCEGFVMSQDKSVLAVLYCSSSTTNGHHSKDRYDINIWKLVKAFDCEDSSKPWCENLKSMSFSSTFRGYSPQPMRIDSHNVLHHPWGQFDLRKLLSDGTANENGNDDPNTVSQISECYKSLDGISFSPDGRFIIGFKLHDSRIVRLITENTSLHSSAAIPVPEAMLCAISYSGDLVVWRDMGGPQHSCYLQDFARDRCTRLPGSEETEYPAHLNLQFTLDETNLVGTMGNVTSPSRQFISIWNVLSEPIQQVKSSSVPSILGLHLTNINEPAFLATIDQWTEVDLLHPDLLTDRINSCKNTKSYIDQKVSKRGQSLAVLSVAEQEYV